MLYYDVIVIGGGPSGLSAAIEASETGVSVLVIDAKQQIGFPEQCGELIPLMLKNAIPSEARTFIQQIDSMATVLPSGEKQQIRAPGIMISRALMEQKLCNLARLKGADYLASGRAIFVEDGGVVVRKRNQQLKYSAQVIIGADGPRSSVRKFIFGKTFTFLHCLQCRLPWQESSRTAKVYFLPALYGGYAWMFPRGPQVNIGLGLHRTGSINSLKKNLDNFIGVLRSHYRIGTQPINWQSGLIPVSGMMSQVVNKGILLTGDAAGLTHPITGGGIPQAILSGQEAGRLAGESVRLKTHSLLLKYNEFCTSFWEKEMARARNRRNELEKNWHQLEPAVKRCWVTFKAYYE